MMIPHWCLRHRPLEWPRRIYLMHVYFIIYFLKKSLKAVATKQYSSCCFDIFILLLQQRRTGQTLELLLLSVYIWFIC